VRAAGIHSGSDLNGTPTLVGKIGIDPAGILSDTGMDDPLEAIKLRAQDNNIPLRLNGTRSLISEVRGAPIRAVSGTHLLEE
jgi:hypothetical protein